MAKYNPEFHHRRSIRLKGYDYSQAGAYFVTVCTWNREGLFGDIKDGKMLLNKYGRVVEYEWLKTVDVRGNVELDYYVIMPNHFHGIFAISDYVGATRWVAHNRVVQHRAIQRIAPTTLQSNSIGAIIGQFKSIVTKQINKLRDNKGCPVWQRNYYEHIIRSEESLNRIREYIVNNPLKWDEDIENPLNWNNEKAKDYYEKIF